MSEATRHALIRADYKPSPYKIDTVLLNINLDDTQTQVASRLSVTHNPANPAGGPLVLDGEEMLLKKVTIAGRALAADEYIVDEKQLIIKNPPANDFVLEIENEINPTTNTALEGIYKSGPIITSQCEARGFRRITYYLDRPDNLAQFTVRLEADKEKYPVLLSNGNGDYQKTTDLGNGRHAVEWFDPFPKPSYLFAAVAGDLKVIEDEFTTMSGRKVDLRIFVQPGYENKVDFAMQSLKRAMKWDEEKYGREYDLDVFHIVATDKFNAGAMENKGLNIFNVSVLVGDHKTSTDFELKYIERVVAHEYFHNWRGNRVTVRDWFELTLKEGLTVLTDREFSADMHSKGLKDVEDAVSLRSTQFREDASPMAHPIRPERVEEFNNIYSQTVYAKGSHVLGMIKTIVGDEAWRAGMDAYFDKFDGQAVTCDDFIDNMQEVTGADLSQFRLWYSQSGTPEVSYTGAYDQYRRIYTLTLKQNTPSTPDQKEKKPLHIPVRIGLIGQSGKDERETLVHLKEAEQTIIFQNVNGPVVPSILRGFSAPVKLTTQPSYEELAFRMAHDKDPVNRYDATEQLMLKQLHKLIALAADGEDLMLDSGFCEAYDHLVENALEGDQGFNARTLQLPPYQVIVRDLKTIDPDDVEDAMNTMKWHLARWHRKALTNIYNETRDVEGDGADMSPAAVGRRALHNAVLSLSAHSGYDDALVWAEKAAADNMTERYAALAVLSRFDTPSAAKGLQDFYGEVKEDTNLVRKWFYLMAAIPHGDVKERIQGLMKHEAFDITNPNLVGTVLGAFMQEHPTVFHAKDGSGYAFIAEQIIAINAVNPHTAARFAPALAEFKRYDEDRQALMITQMERVIAAPNMGAGVKEIIGKALDTARTSGGKPEQKLAL